MRKFSARVDANQGVVVNDLRKCGLSVAMLHQLGSGIPDLLVGYSGLNWLVELKSTEKLWLTDDEQRWHSKWFGQVWIANSAESIVKLIYKDLKQKGLVQEATNLRSAFESMMTRKKN